MLYKEEVSKTLGADTRKNIMSAIESLLLWLAGRLKKRGSAVGPQRRK